MPFRPKILGPKTFGLTLIAVAMASFIAVVLANVLIDPEDVFGTGLVHPHINANRRVGAVRDYQKAPSTTDTLFFASSRGWGIPKDELLRRAGGTGLADFGVPYGLITDHLPVLEFMLRDKARRGEKLRLVFMLLDIDLFGEKSSTNRSIQTYLPPVVSGEAPSRFWLRYLTSIQFDAWRHDLISPFKGAPPLAYELDREPPRAIRLAQADGPPPLPGTRITARAEYAQQLALLRRFVELCRDNNIRLVIATSPLRRENAVRFDAYDIAAVVAAVRALTPVWDFDAPEWLSQRTELWADLSHFRPEVGTMMLDRIFDGKKPPGVDDFGTPAQAETRR